jgi:hypothetical protein
MDAPVPQCKALGGLSGMDLTTSSLLMDFLSFRVLMSPAVLLVIYYFGAVAVPLLVVIYIKKSFKAIEKDISPVHKSHLRRGIEVSGIGQYRGRIVFYAFVMFVMMEFFWRMMFEFFIAYYQMHNALIKIAG